MESKLHHRKNKRKSCSDLPSILYQILHKVRYHFGSLFACFLRLSWRRIPDAFFGAFFCGFRHQSGTQMDPKIDQKSMRNRCKNQLEIRLGFCMASGALLVDFGGVVGTLDLYIVSVSSRRGANLQKFIFCSCLG